MTTWAIENFRETTFFKGILNDFKQQLSEEEIELTYDNIQQELCDWLDYIIPPMTHSTKEGVISEFGIADALELVADMEIFSKAPSKVDFLVFDILEACIDIDELVEVYIVPCLPLGIASK